MAIAARIDCRNSEAAVASRPKVQALCLSLLGDVPIVKSIAIYIYRVFAEYNFLPILFQVSSKKRTSLYVRQE